MRRRRRLLVTAAAASLALSACAGEPSDPRPDTVMGGYVLERPGEGPKLCADVVLTSVPPHCEGVELLGWDWADVPNEEERGGSRWVRAVVVGTCQSGRIVVARPQPEHAVAFQGPRGGMPACYGERSQSRR